MRRLACILLLKTLCQYGRGFLVIDSIVIKPSFTRASKSLTIQEDHLTDHLSVSQINVSQQLTRCCISLQIEQMTSESALSDFVLFLTELGEMSQSKWGDMDSFPAANLDYCN